MLKFINILVLFLLVCVGALFAYITSRTATVVENKNYEGMLAKQIPSNLEGWDCKERPLGDTPEVEHAAKKILRACDYLSRDYISKDGKNKFGLYIAYWEKGKHGTANASSHTPDRCWVENGWKNHLEKRSSNYTFKGLEDLKLMPAYYRYMTFDKAKIAYNVLFWFVTDGKKYDYGEGSTYIRNPIDYFKNMFTTAFLGSPELYFVRMESSSTFEELSKDKGFRQLLEALGKVALVERVEDCAKPSSASTVEDTQNKAGKNK